ncbi:hypothetical protein AX766_07110 [Flavobacterium covae]|nr:hypothetical protein AX766_07110 [Flavobacterium covae]
MHDPRVGRFFSVDPLTQEYPYLSPYSFSENNVIAFNELEGKEKTWSQAYSEFKREAKAFFSTTYWSDLKNKVRSTLYDDKHGYHPKPKNTVEEIVYAEGQIISGFNPAIGVANLHGKYVEGTDIFGDEMGKFDTTMEVVGLIPGGKVIDKTFDGIKALKTPIGKILIHQLPKGFKSFGHLRQFGTQFQAGLAKLGFKGAKLFMQGSSAKGVNMAGEAFDVGRKSDFDVAIVCPELFAKAKELGFVKISNTSPIEAGSEIAKALGVDGLLSKLSKDRSVNAMIFETIEDVKIKEPKSIRIPTNKM